MALETDEWNEEMREAAPKVRRLIAARAPAALVDDIYQTVMAKVIRSAASYRGGRAEAQAYILRIARTVTIDCLRSHARVDKREVGFPGAGETTEDGGPSLAAMSTSVDSRLAREQERAVRRQGMAELPELDRRVLELVFNWVPLKEISEQLGISYARASRAAKRGSAALDRYRLQLSAAKRIP